MLTRRSSSREGKLPPPPPRRSRAGRRRTLARPIPYGVLDGPDGPGSPGGSPTPPRRLLVFWDPTDREAAATRRDPACPAWQRVLLAGAASHLVDARSGRRPSYLRPESGRGPPRRPRTEETRLRLGVSPMPGAVLLGTDRLLAGGPVERASTRSRSWSGPPRGAPRSQGTHRPHRRRAEPSRLAGRPIAMKLHSSPPRRSSARVSLVALTGCSGGGVGARGRERCGSAAPTAAPGSPAPARGEPRRTRSVGRLRRRKPRGRATQQAVIRTGDVAIRTDDPQRARDRRRRPAGPPRRVRSTTSGPSTTSRAASASPTWYCGCPVDDVRARDERRRAARHRACTRGSDRQGRHDRGDRRPAAPADPADQPARPQLVPAAGRHHRPAAPLRERDHPASRRVPVAQGRSATTWSARPAMSTIEPRTLTRAAPAPRRGDLGPLGNAGFVTPASRAIHGPGTASCHPGHRPCGRAATAAWRAGRRAVSPPPDPVDAAPPSGTPSRRPGAHAAAGARRDSAGTRR